LSAISEKKSSYLFKAFSLFHIHFTFSEFLGAVLIYDQVIMTPNIPI
jgi:hypothetical protein